MVKLFNSSGVNSQVPLPLSVPAERVTSSGTPEILMDIVSEPLVSTKLAVIPSGNSSWSVPDTVGVDMSKLGISATGVTLIVTFAVSVNPSLSATV